MVREQRGISSSRLRPAGGPWTRRSSWRWSAPVATFVNGKHVEGPDD